MQSIDVAVIDAAAEAVQRAAAMTSRAQGRLVGGDTLTKSDDSPVTVADFAAQAIVCASLVERLGAGVQVVGEEHADDLADRPELLAGVTTLVSDAAALDRSDLDGGGGLPTTPDEVIEAIAVGAATASTDGSYWTLDPIDGTKGFLRGDQYAIALALIDAGEVVVGVLGCPNLPNGDGSRGAIFVAANGSATMRTTSSSQPVSVAVGAPSTLAGARFCESVESGHSDQGQSAEIARRLGITTEPYRIDSQCKYAAVARGDASIYLRLPTRADYVEKIWDHAAGKFVVETAGGVVTDVAGVPLDFSRGDRLHANRGVIATSGHYHGEVVEAVQSVLG